MKPGRILILVLLVLAAWYAVQGGEYGTSDLVQQRRRQAALQHEVDSLQRIVDSLERYRKSVLTDAAVQERIAREEFGMVKGDRELLYRFTEDAPSPGRDTARRDPDRE